MAEAAQKAAEGLTVNLRSGSDVGSFGEFIRVDLNGNYGELGSRMQSVVWTYYGNDSTYTHAKAPTAPSLQPTTGCTSPWASSWV